MTIQELEAQTAEELEAELLEGAMPANQNLMELVERYRELNKAMAPLKAEQEIIKELVKEEMLKNHVNKFTHDGVVAVELVKTHRKEFDVKGLTEDEPEIAQRYMTVKDGTRFDFKK